METLTIAKDMRRLLVAVSGGADSVALLLLLREQRPELELIAAHFEHGIRGEASLQDAASVRTLCETLGIPLCEESADVPGFAKAWGMGLEEAARRARYEFLRRMQREQHCDGIVLAHHADDQAETVLMHMLRGCGVHGLRGMQAQEDGLLRPLLRVRKQALYEYLREKGVSWREDETNRQADTPRNALRLRVMPEIKRVYPGAVEAIGRLSRLAADEDDYMAQSAMQFSKAHVRALPIGWRIDAQAHPAILRRVIRSLLPLDEETTGRVLSLADLPRGTVNLPGNGRAEKCLGGLYLLTGSMPPLEAQIGEETALGCVTASPCGNQPIRGQKWIQALDADAISGCVIRTRREGDYIVPLGMRGRQSLSDYWINRRVDRPLRDITPLLARGSEVFWVVGEGISEHARLTEYSRAVRLEYRGLLI